MYTTKEYYISLVHYELINIKHSELIIIRLEISMSNIVMLALQLFGKLVVAGQLEAGNIIIRTPIIVQCHYWLTCHLAHVVNVFLYVLVNRMFELTYFIS